MALQYGMNITAGDMMRMLEENDKQQSGVRTWRQLFGNASLNYGAQNDALSANYADAISQAYASNFAQKNAIMNAGLGTGSTDQMLAQNKNALHAAYQTAMSNYATAAGNLAESYGKDVDQIQTDLSTRAQNFRNLYNRAYEYLTKELYGATYSEVGTSTNGAIPITEGEGKNIKIIDYNPIEHDYIKEHGLEWALNEDGSAVRSWDDLSHELFDVDDVLTAKGREFFDQMLNAGAEGYSHTDKDGNVTEMRGFDQWLSDTDSKLRDWWTGGDVYNYTKAGTNAGTAKTLVGLESTDKTYNKWEHQEANLQKGGSAISDYYDAFDKYRKLEQRYDKLTLQNIKNKVSYGGVSAANQSVEDKVRKQFADAKKELSKEFENNTTKVYNELRDQISLSIGSANADTFWRDNQTLLEEYEHLDFDFYDTESFATAQAKFNGWYNKVIAAVNAYSKKLTSGKTSGF